MSTVERAADVTLAEPRIARRSDHGRQPGAATGWRHLVGIVAMGFALFPVVYVVSAAFNADASLTSSSVIPRQVTLHNFHVLFQTHFSATESSYAGAHYLRWFANSIIVAGGTAILTVLLSALAAYAFSRFRFRGRRSGCSRCS
jgi:arabinogalactan oligomer/maltooligosaccharide transport system permease protein